VAALRDGDAKSEDDALHTSDLLASLLALIESGEIDASSPQGRRMVRRIEGALAALRAVESSE
jgi:hypothetical protein